MAARVACWAALLPAFRLVVLLVGVVGTNPAGWGQGQGPAVEQQEVAATAAASVRSCRRVVRQLGVCSGSSW